MCTNNTVLLFLSRSGGTDLLSHSKLKIRKSAGRTLGHCGRNACRASREIRIANCLHIRLSVMWVRFSVTTQTEKQQRISLSRSGFLANMEKHTKPFRYSARHTLFYCLLL